MSIGTSHVFSQLDKNSKPMEGQRLVRLIAKGENKAPNLQSSLCVSVPSVTGEQVAEHIDSLLPHIVNWVQEIQDKIIREYRVTSGNESIHEDLFDVAHVVEWLSDNGTFKLTKEYMINWFNEDYSEVAHEWISQRFAQLGKTDVTGEKVTQHVAILRDVIAGWCTGGKYKPSIPQCRMMIAFANDVENDGIMGMVAKNSQSRLDKLLEEQNEDALGFGS